MFFKSVDQSSTKFEIRDALLTIAANNGEELSKSKAHNLATKFKQGIYDPLLARFLQHTDTTGEIACGFIANPFAPIEQGVTA